MRKYLFIVAALLSLIIGCLLINLSYYFTFLMFLSFVGYGCLAILYFKGKLN